MNLIGIVRGLSGKALFFVALSCLGAQANAAPDAVAGKAKAQICMACHGESGIAQLAEAPNLAAQPALAIFYQLVQFREHYRKGGGMEAIASALSDQDMRDIAAFFTSLPAPPPQSADQSKVALGQSISQQAFCQSCHGAQLHGQKHIPRLAGQKADYLALQLKSLRSGSRVDMDGTMGSAAKALTDDQIDAIVAFAQTLN
jgi:cytochrome c553